ncbi:hypothetical protein GF337_01595 [candidate division KSB1 bacterium]|nr:hypothetical protein [candidate division KSB1 bacterium]
MDYTKLTNIQLVKLLSRETENEIAWLTFVNRFHRFICTAIYRESKRKGYKEGCEYLEDIAQDIYFNLKKNNCKALKNFKGNHENAIYKYLEVCAIRMVCNKLTTENNINSKRPPISKKKSLSDNFGSRNGSHSDTLQDMIVNEDWKSIYNSVELSDAIKFCLKKIFAGTKKNKERNLLILNYALFDDLSAKEIASSASIDIDYKTVLNVLNFCKSALKSCLQNLKIH